MKGWDKMSKELEVLNEIEKRLSDVPYQEEIQIIKQALQELKEKTKVLNEVKEWQNNFNGEYTLDEILDELQNLDDILKQLVGEGDE